MSDEKPKEEKPKEEQPKEEQPKEEQPKRLKSAYELALERMSAQGIEPPREESLGAEGREKAAALRQKAEAKIAELEILHKSSLAKIFDPAAREKAEEEYRRERRRIEEERDRQIGKLRG
jgi:hypothetical protein